MNTRVFPPLRAVVFDLDGTLVDSMPFVLRAFAHALEPFRPDLDVGGIFHRLGGPPARVMRELTGDEKKAAEALRRMDEFGFHNGNAVEEFGGMRELLDALKARGLSLAIWTGRDRGTTEEILSAHGMTHLFSTIVCGDDLPTHKPQPDGMTEILRRLGVSAEETLYVGDADADVLGGSAAGVATLLIRHDREVANEILSRAWLVTQTPPEAYARIIEEVTRRA